MGVVRFTAIHSNSKKCDGPKDFVKVCYESKLKASTINKTDLGKEFEWQKFRTADQVNETYLLYGELNDITGDGFTVDFDPKKVTSEDF
jgi:hypothetical protein